MQGFYRSAAIVRRINDRLLQRFEEQFDGEAAPEPLDDALRPAPRLPGRARSRAWPHGDPVAVFALFAMWAAHPAVARPAFADRARAGRIAARAAFLRRRRRRRCATRFMALLRGAAARSKTLTRMARLGVLGRWLPAFAQVSGRMQFDLFHVYTVDQHTLLVLRNLAAFRVRHADERFSIAHEVWPRLRKPELLLLAGLFHDIAKGRGGDHSELGAVDAREFCARARPERSATPNWSHGWCASTC